MITNQGSTTIKKFFGGQIGGIAQTLSVGVSNAAESRESLIMGSEVLNVPISSVSSDLVNSRLVFRAVLPPAAISTVYEIGIYQGDRIRRNVPLMLTDPNLVWTNAVVEVGGGRANPSTLRVDFTANTATTATRTDLSEDLSDLAGTDYFVANFTGHVNMSSLAIRIGTDSSNYFTFTIPGASTGYNSVRLSKSAATTTGNPNWATIGYLSVRPSGSAGGPGSVLVDRIGFEQNPANTESVLVARKVLSTPYQTDLLVPNEVEYALGIFA